MATPTGAAVVNLCHSQIFGDYLVDAKGMTLYAFAKDTPNSGTTNCTSSQCMALWIPFLTNGTPTIGPNNTAANGGTGLQASLLGTISRSDGSTQVTYNGWPLYYFSGDKAPGDINGELWFVMPPTGPAGSTK